MAQITLLCPSTPGLKLGPGTAGLGPRNDKDGSLVVDGDVITFVDGHATFDDKDFPDWQVWATHPGTPTITRAKQVLTEVGVALGAGGDVFTCPTCGKEFDAANKLRMHEFSHK